MSETQSEVPEQTAEEQSIAEAALSTGLSAHTLRYYERIGLIDLVARGTRNQRRYDATDLAWLAFLQRLRATGMPIGDMQRFAELRRAGQRTVSARRAFAGSAP